MSKLVSAATITVDAKTTNKQINIVTDFSRDELTTGKTEESQYTNFITHLDISDIVGRRGRVDLTFTENNTTNDRTDCVLVKAGNPSMTVGKLELTQLAPVGNYFSWGASSTSAEWNDTSLRNTYQTTYTSVSFEKDSEWITIDENHTGKTDFVVILSPYEAQNVQPRVGKVIAKNGNTTVGTWTITQNSKTQPIFNWTEPSSTVAAAGTNYLSNSYENTYPDLSFETSDWIHIESTTDGSVEISVNENVGSDGRTGYVKAKSGDNYISTGVWTIEQAGSGPTPEYFFYWDETRESTVKTSNCPYTGTSLNESFITNYTELTIEVDDSSRQWITKTTGTGSPVYVSIAENNTEDIRTGHIIVKHGDAEVGRWTIEQDAEDVQKKYFHFDNQASGPYHETGYTSAITSTTLVNEEIGGVLIKTNYGKPTASSTIDANKVFNFQFFGEGEEYVIHNEDGKPKITLYGEPTSEYFPSMTVYLVPNKSSSPRDIIIYISSKDPSDGGDWGPDNYATLEIKQKGRQPYYFVWEYDNATGGTLDDFDSNKVYEIDHTTTSNDYEGLAQDFGISFVDSGETSDTYSIDFLTNMFMTDALDGSQFTLTITISDESGNTNEYKTTDGSALEPIKNDLEGVGISIACRAVGETLATSDQGQFVVTLPENREYRLIEEPVIVQNKYKNCSKVYDITLRKTFDYNDNSDKIPGINNHDKSDSNSYVYWMNDNTGSDPRTSFMRWRIVQKPNGTILESNWSGETKGDNAVYCFLKNNVPYTNITYSISASSLYDTTNLLHGYGEGGATTTCDYFRDYRVNGRPYKGEYECRVVNDSTLPIYVVCGVTNDSTSFVWCGHNTADTTTRTNSMDIIYLGPYSIRNNEKVSGSTVSKYWNWDNIPKPVIATANYTQDENPFHFGITDNAVNGDTFTWCESSNVERNEIVPSISFIKQIPADKNASSERLNFTTKYISSSNGKHELSFECNDDSWLEFSKIGEPIDTYNLYNCKTSLTTRQWKENDAVVEYDANHLTRKGRGVVKHGDAEVGEVNVLQVAPAARIIEITYPSEYKIQMTGDTSSIQGAIMKLKLIERGGTGNVIVEYTGTIDADETVLSKSSSGPGKYYTTTEFSETGRLLLNIDLEITIDEGSATATNPNIHFTDLSNSWLTYNAILDRHIDTTLTYETKTYLNEVLVMAPPKVKDNDNGWLAVEGKTDKYRFMYRGEELTGTPGDDYIIDEMTNKSGLTIFDYIITIPEPGEGYNGTLGLS